MKSRESQLSEERKLSLIGLDSGLLLKIFRVLGSVRQLLILSKAFNKAYNDKLIAMEINLVLLALQKEDAFSKLEKVLLKNPQLRPKPHQQLQFDPSGRQLPLAAQGLFSKPRLVRGSGGLMQQPMFPLAVRASFFRTEVCAFLFIPALYWLRESYFFINQLLVNNFNINQLVSLAIVWGGAGYLFSKEDFSDSSLLLSLPNACLILSLVIFSVSHWALRLSDKQRFCQQMCFFGVMGGFVGLLSERCLSTQYDAQVREEDQAAVDELVAGLKLEDQILVLKR